MSDRGRPDIQKKIAYILEKIAGRNGPLRQKDLAVGGGCTQASVSRAMQTGRVQADMFCGMLEGMKLDVCGLIDTALSRDSLDGVPASLAAFLSLYGSRILSQEQWQALYWLGRAGWFSPNATTDDFLEIYAELDKRAKTWSTSE